MWGRCWCCSMATILMKVTSLCVEGHQLLCTPAHTLKVLYWLNLAWASYGSWSPREAHHYWGIAWSCPLRLQWLQGVGFSTAELLYSVWDSLTHSVTLITKGWSSLTDWSSCDEYVTVHGHVQSVLGASGIERYSSPWPLLSCDYSTLVLVVAIYHIINRFQSSPFMCHRMGYASLQIAA